MLTSEPARGPLRVFVIYALPPLAAFAVALLLWEAWVQWRDVSILIVPPPSAVIERFFEQPDFFWREGGWTLYEATFGLVLGSAFAIALAVLMAHSPFAERSLLPIAIVIKVTPLVAVVPVLVILLGFGTWPKVIIAAVFSFLPVLLNAMVGFRDVDSSALEFLRSLRASRWQIFWKLRVPSSMPYLFLALKTAYPLALVGAVVAEWFVGDRGLGIVVFRANSNLDTPTLFAAVGVLVIIGTAIYFCLSLIERRLLFWHPSVRTMQ